MGIPNTAPRRSKSLCKFLSPSNSILSWAEEATFFAFVKREKRDENGHNAETSNNQSLVLLYKSFQHDHFTVQFQNQLGLSRK